MPTFADQVKRLRVAAVTGSLPPDLAHWVVATLAQLAPVESRRELRDAFLREAAGLLEGSAWARAHRLAAEIGSVARQRRTESEIGRLVRQALEVDPACPSSPRQILRIVADTEPGCAVTEVAI